MSGNLLFICLLAELVLLVGDDIDHIIEETAKKHNVSVSDLKEIVDNLNSILTEEESRA